MDKCYSEGSWDTCLKQNLLPEGEIQEAALLLKQLVNPNLLKSSENVGPYRVVQQVIEETCYHAYLFQDADDWSSSDRLEKLLEKAISTGGQLVGTQELRIFKKDNNLIPVRYLLDVNQALTKKPGHGLLHPTSLVTRNLIMQLGGFATGLRFGGDSDFLLRAVMVAKVATP